MSVNESQDGNIASEMANEHKGKINTEHHLLIFNDDPEKVKKNPSNLALETSCQKELKGDPQDKFNGVNNSPLVKPLSPETVNIVDTKKGDFELQKEEVPTESSPEKPEKIKNKLFFILMMGHLFVDEFTYAINHVSMPALIPQMKTPEYFDIHEDDLDTFNFWFVFNYIFGQVIGGLAKSFVFYKVNPSYLRASSRIILVAAILISIIHNSTLAIGMRFVVGFCLGVTQPINIAEAFTLAPNHLKGFIGAGYSYSFTIGACTSTLFVLMVNQEVFAWYSVHIFVSSIQVLLLLTNIFYMRIDISMAYAIKHDNLEKAHRIVSKYAHEKTARQMVAQEKEQIDIVKKSAQSVKDLFKLHYREFLVMLFITVAMFATFLNGSIANIMLMFTDDIDNKDEVSNASLYISIGCFCELFVKTFFLFSKRLANRRKRNFVVGCFLFGTLWILLMICYLTEKWNLARILIIPWFVVVGAVLYTAFYSIISDMLNANLMGGILAVGRLTDLGYQAFFSFTFPKESDVEHYWKAALLFAVISFALGITLWIFFFETHGLTKHQVRERMINGSLCGKSKKQREQQYQTPKSESNNVEIVQQP